MRPILLIIIAMIAFGAFVPFFLLQNVEAFSASPPQSLLAQPITEPTSTPEPRRGVVVSSATLRQQASTRSTAVASLRGNTVITILETVCGEIVSLNGITTAQWHHIAVQEGDNTNQGYIWAGLVTIQAEQPLLQATETPISTQTATAEGSLASHEVELDISTVRRLHFQNQIVPFGLLDDNYINEVVTQIGRFAGVGFPQQGNELAYISGVPASEVYERDGIYYFDFITSHPDSSDTYIMLPIVFGQPPVDSFCSNTAVANIGPDTWTYSQHGYGGGSNLISSWYDNKQQIAIGISQTPASEDTLHRACEQLFTVQDAYAAYGGLSQLNLDILAGSLQPDSIWGLRGYFLYQDAEDMVTGVC